MHLAPRARLFFVWGFSNPAFDLVFSAFSNLKEVPSYSLLGSSHDRCQLDGHWVQCRTPSSYNVVVGGISPSHQHPGTQGNWVVPSSLILSSVRTPNDNPVKKCACHGLSQSSRRHQESHSSERSRFDPLWQNIMLQPCLPITSQVWKIGRQDFGSRGMESPSRGIPSPLTLVSRLNNKGLCQGPGTLKALQ